MKDMRELTREFLKNKNEIHKIYRDLTLTATGQYLLDEITEHEFNTRVKVYKDSEALDCRLALYDIAKRSEIPLAVWCVGNLPTHVAFYVIRRLPLYAEDLDSLAGKNKWCDEYKDHRAAAIKSGVLKVKK